MVIPGWVWPGITRFGKEIPRAASTLNSLGGGGTERDVGGPLLQTTTFGQPDGAPRNPLLQTTTSGRPGDSVPVSDFARAGGPDVFTGYYSWTTTPGLLILETYFLDYYSWKTHPPGPVV